MRFQHVVVTMLNRRLGGRGGFPASRELEDEWLRSRWQLFTTYTVPSFAAQTEQNFTWLVLCHPDSPAWLRDLTGRVAVPADVYFSFASPDPALDRLEPGSADGLLVTRIDSDDLWHRTAIERIQEDCTADPYTSEIVTFTDGYLLDDETRRMRPYHHRSPPFSTKINLDPDMDPLDLGGNHMRTAGRFTMRSISDGEPMFVTVAHQVNSVQQRAFDASDRRWLAADVTAGILQRDFGVALAEGTLTPVAGPGLAGPHDTARPHNPERPRGRADFRRTGPCRQQRVVVSIACSQPSASVARSAETALDQTHRDVLVIVASDGGGHDDDGRWAALRHIDDPRLVTIDYPGTRGRYFIDQVALMARLGQYLLIQDGSEWSEPDRVTTLLGEMRRQHCSFAVSPHYQHGRSAHGTAVVNSPFGFFGPVVPVARGDPSSAGYHALFDAPRLLRVGGCYGGFRSGYDTFLSQLMRMTGTAARTDRPLYHRAASPNDAAFDRDDASGLAGLHEEAYHTYCEYLQGYVGRAAFSQHLRALAWRHVARSEWDILRDEAHRLRWHAACGRQPVP